MERTNISDLNPARFTAAPEFCAVDLSYLSLCRALPILEPLLTPSASMVCLIKPLYEGLAEAALADLSAIRELLRSFLPALDRAGARRVCGLTISPIAGGRGALEFLTWLSPEPAQPAEFSGLIQASLDEAATVFSDAAPATER